MLRTLTGSFTIPVIRNGMNLANVESYTQKVVRGLVIHIALLLDKIRHRMRHGFLSRRMQRFVTSVDTMSCYESSNERNPAIQA